MAEKEPALKYVHSTNMPAFFEELGLSLIVSTYQAQRIMAVSSKGDRLNICTRVIPRPMGAYADSTRMVVCSKSKVWFFGAQKELRDEQNSLLPNDLIFVPRQAHVTGDILAHGVGFFKNRVILVNTRFSCLATIADHASFIPIWKPPFITELAPEDRCHLNGMVMDQNGPKYVTALGETDTKQGWRDNKAQGGCIIDVPAGKVVCSGLSMPHSPQIYNKKLWVLESGTGELQTVNPVDGTREPVVKLPGFLRGLAFHGPYAFVGLCKIRETNMFGGLPIGEKPDELECAIYVVDLTKREAIGFIRFERGIEELFDISILPGVRKPEIIGFEEDTLDGIFVLPPGKN